MLVASVLITLLHAVGHTATHAVVAARLITKDKDHGIHMFLVQLRSLEDHKPLPGNYLTLLLATMVTGLWICRG